MGYCSTPTVGPSVTDAGYAESVRGLKVHGGVSELVQEGALKAPGPLGRVGSNPTTATRNYRRAGVRGTLHGRPCLCDNHRVGGSLYAEPPTRRVV